MPAQTSSQSPSPTTPADILSTKATNETLHQSHPAIESPEKPTCGNTSSEPPEQLDQVPDDQI